MASWSCGHRRRVRSCPEQDPRGAVAVYLFGHVARGEARPDSDALEGEHVGDRGALGRVSLTIE
jgi:hypothetical protein